MFLRPAVPFCLTRFSELVFSKYLTPLFWVVLCLLCAVTQVEAQAITHLTHITQAQLSPGLGVGNLANQTSTASPVPVSLPDAWNAQRPQRGGLFTYELQFEALPEQTQSTHALYIPRVGNRYQIWLNGQNIANAGELSNLREDYAHQPLFIRLSSGGVRAGNNQLKIVVAGEPGRYAGLSSVYFGDYASLLARYEVRHFFQTAASLAIISMCAAIGLLALAIGVFANNRHFLLFGVGSLAWALRTSYAVTNYVPFDYRLFLFAYDALYAIAVVCLLLSITYAVRFRRRWVRPAAYGFIATELALCALQAAGLAWARGLFLQLLLAVVVLGFGLYVRQCWAAPKRMSYLLLLAFSVSLVFGIYDQVMIMQFKNGFELFALSRYSFLITALALSALFGTRFAKMNASLVRSHQRTNARLKAAKAALNHAFALRLHEQKISVLQQERWRMMQDMHDGLGGRLVSLQQAVGNADTQPAVLGHMVKQTLDELRLTVNALGKSHAQVSYMLGSLRERLDTLCAQHGKLLAWAVDDIPELVSVDEVKIAAIEKMVLEIFTNIAKHSTACQVKLAAGNEAGSHVWVRVTENGRGFETTQIEGKTTNDSSGKGLSGLAKRATLIGAELRFNDDGCEIEIVLPYH